MPGRQPPVLLVTMLLFVGTAGASVFPVHTASDWNDGAHSNTTVADGGLELAAGSSDGTYLSEPFDASDTYTWDEIVVDADLNGGAATVIVETSNDSFATVQGQASFDLSGGTETFDLSGLADTRYVRFNYSLTRGSDTPHIASTNITIADNTTFIIRDSCLAGEESLFSISGRENAHAAEPDYYDQQVCAAGIDRSDYKRVCTDVESDVLSFAAANASFVHLSTDSDRYDHQLCTGELSIGIRKDCPGTTKAIASIYELPESHIAEPGYYDHHLCGAVFDEVELMMQFHLGDDTVHINETENPDTGTYRDDEGWRSGFISAENDSLVAGIVSGEYTRTTGFRYAEDGDDHVFGVIQDRNVDVSYFLPFTEGTSRSLAQRQDLIERGAFLDQPTPSFGLELAEQMLLHLTLEFTSIDIVSDLRLSSGIHRLVIENMGANADGEPRVSINVTAS